MIRSNYSARGGQHFAGISSVSRFPLFLNSIRWHCCCLGVVLHSVSLCDRYAEAAAEIADLPRSFRDLSPFHRLVQHGEFCGA